jgi:hypothetical protein
VGLREKALPRRGGRGRKEKEGNTIMLLILISNLYDTFME